MTAFLSSFPPILQALFATLFTWLVTALGAAFVFVRKTLSRRLMVSMLGFAAGVMIAASFFSLLLPAIDMAEANGTPGWLPAVVGFLAGGLFLYGVDKLLPHLHPGLASSESEGIKTHWQRSILLVLAITMHNFPEGLAVGVAFGAVAAGIPSANLTSAVAELSGGDGGLHAAAR
jgi:ZIP family zinc transporter